MLQSLLVSASLQCADPLFMGRAVRALRRGGADWLHIDLMDGHFVPNFALNFDLIRALKRFSPLPLDVHIMALPSCKWALAAREAGADTVVWHVESGDDHAPLLANVREAGGRAGLAVSPGTPMDALLPYLDALDQIVVMAVTPGFAGQAFLPDTPARVKWLRDARAQKGLRFSIEVDGGMDARCAALCARAGADVLVAGAKCALLPGGHVTRDTRAFVKGLRALEK